jgi:hypothetical protein
LFGGKKGGYDSDDPPMASYGDGVLQLDSVGRNLDIELCSRYTGALSRRADLRHITVWEIVPQ